MGIDAHFGDFKTAKATTCLIIAPTFWLSATASLSRYHGPITLENLMNGHPDQYRKLFGKIRDECTHSRRICWLCSRSNRKSTCFKPGKKKKTCFYHHIQRDYFPQAGEEARHTYSNGDCASLPPSSIQHGPKLTAGISQMRPPRVLSSSRALCLFPRKPRRYHNLLEDLYR